MPHLQQVSPGQVGAQGSCRGKQAVGIFMYQRSPSHGHKLDGQPRGRSVPRALAVKHLYLECLEGCLCSLPPAAALALGVPSPWRLPVCWWWFCPAAIFLLVGVASVCLCSWLGVQRGLRESRSTGLGWALQLTSCSPWISVFHAVKWGQWAHLLTRLL